MGLSQDEQRTLDAIEEQLRKQDPLLAFRLAGFRPYLTPPPPATPERRRRLRWVVSVAVLIAVLSLAVLAVLAALGGHGGRRHAPPATPSSAQVPWHQPGQDGG